MIGHHHTHNTTAAAAATNLQLSASLAQEIFPPFASRSASGGEDFRTPKYPQKPRKKRTKLIRIDSPNGASSSSVVPAKPKSGKKPDPSAPKITEPCSECGRKFWSVKALFGHMRCHPERQWRGINPPPNFRRSAQAKNEAETELTEEDHEVAACLLMLARTSNNTYTNNTNSSATVNAGVSSDYSLLETESMAREVDCRFECSSCKKVFGSHQALGGHRASHKNVKGCFAITRSDSTEEELVVENHNNVVIGGGELMRRGDNEEEEEEEMMTIMGGGHKCGICLRVFSSGQALGGHKRCHWERGEEPPQRVAEGGGGGGLDLNLPAPVEHDPFPSYSSALALDLRLGI